MTTVSESSLQLGLQTQLQSLTQFANEHVVINDYELMDAGAAVERICIIANSDTFDALQAPANRSDGTIPIPATIAIRFVDWKESLDNFRDMRQAILNLFNDTTGARALGLDAVSVDSVTAGSPINYVGIPDGASQLPIWVTQEINFNVMLF